MYPQNNNYRNLIILGALDFIAIAIIIYSMNTTNFVGEWLYNYFPCELPCSHDIETGETLCPSSPGSQCLNMLETYAIIGVSILTSIICGITVRRKIKQKNYSKNNTPIKP